jgi:acyl-CoA synthetase (AMP-forming)/AMP-acid ligase II
MAAPQQEFCSLVEMLRKRADAHPGKPAYVFLSDGEHESGSLTYGELDLKSRVLAAQLQQEVIPGTRALLLYPSGLEFITAFFGCLYAGIVAVPLALPHLVRLNRTLPRLRAIAHDAEAKLVLTTATVGRRMNELIASAPELAGSRFIATDHVVQGSAVQWQEPRLASDAIAFLQYTSGSTSTPRGVVLSHLNILQNLAYIQQCEGNTEDSRSVSWLPIHHDMGLIEGILQPAFGGYTAHLMPPVSFLQRPIRWLQAISRYRATISGGPDFAYELCTRKITPEQCRDLDLRCWKVAYNGSEPIRASSMVGFGNKFSSYGFTGHAFRPVYGLAEATLLVSSGGGDKVPASITVDAAALARDEVCEISAEDERGITLVGCGVPGAPTRAVIVNPATCKVCRYEEVGEIWVASPSVARGYWNRQRDTEQTFQATVTDSGEGPFLRTGDLGFLRDNHLFITGRIKDVIIIRGGKFYPQDIEQTVERTHPMIRPGGAAAFSIPSATGERLVVLAELDRSMARGTYADRLGASALMPPNFDRAVGDLREAIADQHEIQVSVIWLLSGGVLPKTTSGKLQRYACRAGFLAGHFEPIVGWPDTCQEHVGPSVSLGESR